MAAGDSSATDDRWFDCIGSLLLMRAVSGELRPGQLTVRVDDWEDEKVKFVQEPLNGLVTVLVSLQQLESDVFNSLLSVSFNCVI